jgi:hypothetical protein
MACAATLACALAYTYIVAAKSVWVTGVGEDTALRQVAAYGTTPLRYRENARAVASVVFLWVGMVFTFVRWVVTFFSFLHLLLFWGGLSDVY